MKTNIPPRPELYDPELVLVAVRKALCFCFISNGTYCFFSEEQLALVRDCCIHEGSRYRSAATSCCVAWNGIIPTV